MKYRVRIWLLGPPRIQVSGHDTDFGTRKAIALLSYLVVTDQPHSRETLETLLWPEYNHESASQAFRQTLYILRQRLGKNILPGIRKQVVLDDSSNVWIDVKEFQAAADTGLAGDLPQHEGIQFLERAVALYQGDFLAGFTLKDSQVFDEWQLLETEGLRHKYSRVLEMLVQYHSTHGFYDQALDYALRQVHFDQLNEAAHRNVMRAYTQTGQRAAALHHYDEWAQILDHNLHIDPSEETCQLREMIASEEFVLAEDESEVGNRVDPIGEVLIVYGESLHSFTSSGPVADRPKHNLPSQATGFVGREIELAELAKLIDDPKCRLITILAPGGMGKTRLALEIAKQIVGVIPRGHPRTIFPNGVWFIELAQIQSTEGIVNTIANAVRYRFQGDRRSPKQQLLDYFRAKKTLLIMDNFEHLLDEAGIVDEIIQAAPNAKIIATSRERLDLYGETVLTLNGLEIPDGKLLKDTLQYNAIKLFINSAQRVHPGYELRASELDHVVRICRLCGGMPLAIELAASWVETLSLQEIAVEIAQNLDFLKTALRDVPERHRSIRAIFDCSWNLLKEEERGILVKLAVFRGSFTRKAAQAVTGVGLQQLKMLVNKSLLQRNDENARYQVHELLRQYIEGELRTRCELQSIHHTHSKYYLKAIHNLKEDLDGKDQKGALKSIETDIENVGTAAFHAAMSGFYPELVSALYNLWRFYLIRGQFSPGETFFTEVVNNMKKLPASLERDLALGEAMAYQSFYSAEIRNFQKAGIEIQESEMLLKDVPDLRLQVMLAYCQARLYVPSGDAKNARPLLEKAIDLCRQLGDRYLEAHGLHRLSSSYWLQNNERDMSLATKYMEEAYRIRLEINDTLGIAWSLSLLGSYAMTEKRYEEGERLLLEGLSLYRQIGHLEATPHNLGVFAMRRGQWDKARQYMAESLAVAHETGDLNMVSWRLWILGNIEFHTGNYVRAKALYTEGKTLCKQIANNVWLGSCWNGLGSVAMAVGDLIPAEQFFHRGLEAWRKEENKNFIPISHRYLGQVARLRENYEKAHEHFDQALAIFNELEDEGGRIITQQEMVSLYFDEGKMTQARTSAEEILAVSSGNQSAEDQLNSLELMITSIVCHTILGTISIRESDIQKALYHYERILQIAWQHYPIPYFLMFIRSTIDYFRGRGDYERAVEIAAFVTQCKGTFAYDRRYATALLTEMKDGMDAGDYKFAVKHGKSLELETVVNLIHAEIGDGKEFPE